MSITYKQQKDPLKTSIDPRINELTNMTKNKYVSHNNQFDNTGGVASELVFI